MIFEELQAVFDNRSIKNPTDRFVLVALAYHDNDKHGCFPSAGRLADETHYRRATIFDAIKRLEAEGYINKISGTGRGRSNRYTLNLEKIREMVRLPNHLIASNCSGNGTVDTSEMVRQTPINGTATATLNSISKRKRSVSAESALTGATEVRTAFDSSSSEQRAQDELSEIKSCSQHSDALTASAADSEQTQSADEKDLTPTRSSADLKARTATMAHIRAGCAHIGASDCFDKLSSEDQERVLSYLDEFKSEGLRPEVIHARVAGKWIASSLNESANHPLPKNLLEDWILNEDLRRDPASRNRKHVKRKQPRKAVKLDDRGYGVLVAANVAILREMPLMKSHSACKKYLQERFEGDYDVDAFFDACVAFNGASNDDSMDFWEYPVPDKYKTGDEYDAVLGKNEAMLCGRNHCRQDANGDWRLKDSKWLK